MALEPSHPVVPVEDIWVRVVPRPVYELHGHDVVGQVHQHLHQPRCGGTVVLLLLLSSSCEGLAVPSIDSVKEGRAVGSDEYGTRFI